MTPITPGDPTMVVSMWLWLVPLIVVIAIFSRLTDW